MELFEFDDKTGLPKIKPVALVIHSFKELIRIVRRTDGDADGRKKLHNYAEFAYMYFTNHYSSKYRLMPDDERDSILRRLLKMDPRWKPDEIYLNAVKDFREMQETESLELVDNIRGSIKSLNKFMKKANGQIENLNITQSKEVNDYLNTIDRIPKTVENLKRAEAQLEREQDSMSKGRKGRGLNKFEMPDK